MKSWMYWIVICVLGMLASSCTDRGEISNPKESGKLESAAEQEKFDVFYERFKNDKNFQIERTIFPIKVTTYFGYGDSPEIKEAIELWAKAEVTSGKRSLYVDEATIKSAGYSHFVEMKSVNLASVFVGREESEAAVEYIFEQRSGLWYLVDYADYWGS
jgi:hypothetical protein